MYAFVTAIAISVIGLICFVIAAALHLSFPFMCMAKMGALMVAWQRYPELRDSLLTARSMDDH
jgi:hypothetical protein